MTVFPVILCGGSGTRLWPLSREMLPKQFVRFTKDETLFECALQRARSITSNPPIVVCNASHRFFVLNFLKKQKQSGEIILEPLPKNTAPAVALAAACALERDVNAILLILPSDHLLKNTSVFSDAVNCALRLAQNENIVTFGVTPRSPATGFGYIHKGDTLGEKAYRVIDFKEKPDKATAQTMLDSGQYLWNSGMFVVSANFYLQELERNDPRMYQLVNQAWQNRSHQFEFVLPEEKVFGSVSANSIDYAVMEKTEHAAVVELNSEWNDLGTWEAFYDIGRKDKDGNVLHGDTVLVNSRDNLVYSNSRLVTMVGVNNLSIVETKDAILVAGRDSVQDVKKIVEQLNRNNRTEKSTHTIVYRPWGFYESLCGGFGFQVKQITVLQGEQLSMQRHQHRSEHWVVVSGLAEIVNGNLSMVLHPGESTFIPIMTKHRLQNASQTEPLVIIEVQCGNYLGEDDIERFSDKYHRV